MKENNFLRAHLVVGWAAPCILRFQTDCVRSSQAPLKLKNRVLRGGRSAIWLTTVMVSGGKDSEPPNDGESGNASQDWDSSWKEFQEKTGNAGGVFELPLETSDEKQTDYEGEQVEKLTNAWSNESGFLVAIGIIGLIGLFYAYVFATGGINGR